MASTRSFYNGISQSSIDVTGEFSLRKANVVRIIFLLIWTPTVTLDSVRACRANRKPPQVLLIARERCFAVTSTTSDDLTYLGGDIKGAWKRCKSIEGEDHTKTQYKGCLRDSWDPNNHYQGSTSTYITSLHQLSRNGLMT